MDWASSQWKQDLPLSAVQKVNALEEQVCRMQKERQQKQLQIENLEQALDCQKRKVEEEKSQNCSMIRDLQRKDELCKSYEDKYQRLQNEIQSRDARMVILETQLQQMKKSHESLPSLEADLEAIRAEKENLKFEMLNQSKVVQDLEAKLNEVKEKSFSTKGEFCGECFPTEPEAESLEQSNTVNESAKTDSMNSANLLMPQVKYGTPTNCSFHTNESEGKTASRKSRTFSDSSVMSLSQGTEEKVAQLEKRLKQLTQELECHRYNSDAIKLQLEQKFKEKESALKSEIKDQAQVIAQMDSHLKETTTKLQQEKTQANQLLDITKTQLEKLEKRARELENDVKEKSKFLREQELVIQEQESRILEFQKLKDTLESSNDISQKETKSLEDKNLVLSNKVKQLEEELSFKSSTVESFKERIEEYEKRYEKVHAELEDKVRALKDQELLMHELESKISDIRKQKEDLDAESQSKLTLLEEQLNYKESELACSKSELLQHKEHLKELRNELTDKTQRLHEQEVLLKQQDSELENIKKFKSQLESSNAEYLHEIDAMKEDCSKLNNTLKLSGEEMILKKAELEDMKNKLSERDKAYKEKQNELDNIKSALQIQDDVAEQQTRRADELQKLNNDLQRKGKQAEESILMLDSELEQLQRELQDAKLQLTQRNNDQEERYEKVHAELEDKVRALKDQELLMHELESKISDIRKEKEDLDVESQSKLTLLEEQLNYKESELASSKSELLQHKEHLKELRNELTDKTQRLHEQELLLKQQESELENIKEFKEQLESSNAEYRHEIDAMKEDYSKQNNTLKLFEEEMILKKAELEDMKNKLSEKDKNCQSLMEDLESKRKFIENLESLTNQHTCDIKNMEGVIAESHNKISLLEQQLNMKSSELNHTACKLSDSEQDCKALNNELHDKIQMLQEQELIVKQLEADINNAQRSSNCLESSNIRYQQEIDSLKKDCTMLNSSLKQLEEELVAKKSDLEDVTNKLSRKDEECSIIKRELEERSTLLQNQSLVIQQHEAEIKTLEKLKVTLEEKNSSFLKQNECLNESIASISSKLEQLEENLKVKEIELLEIRNKSAINEENQKQLCKELELGSKMLEDQKNLILQHESSICELQKLKQNLEALNSDYQSKIIILEQQLSLQSIELDETKLKSSKYEEEFSSMKSDLEQKEKTIEHKSLLLQQHEAKILELQKCKQDSEQEGSCFQQQIEVLSEDVSSLTRKLEDTEEQLKVKQVELEDMQFNRIRDEEDFKMIRDEMDEKIKILEDKKLLIEQQESRINELLSLKENSDECIANYERKIKQFEEDNLILNDSLKELEEKLIAKDLEVDNFKNSATEYKKNYASLKEEFDQNACTLHDQALRINQLESRMEELNNANEELMGSLKNAQLVNGTCQQLSKELDATKSELQDTKIKIEAYEKAECSQQRLISKWQKETPFLKLRNIVVQDSVHFLSELLQVVDQEMVQLRQLGLSILTSFRNDLRREAPLEDEVDISTITVGDILNQIKDNLMRFFADKRKLCADAVNKQEMLQGDVEKHMQRIQSLTSEIEEKETIISAIKAQVQNILATMVDFDRVLTAEFRCSSYVTKLKEHVESDDAEHCLTLVFINESLELMTEHLVIWMQNVSQELRAKEDALTSLNDEYDAVVKFASERDHDWMEANKALLEKDFIIHEQELHVLRSVDELEQEKMLSGKLQAEVCRLENHLATSYLEFIKYDQIVDNLVLQLLATQKDVAEKQSLISHLKESLIKKHHYLSLERDAESEAKEIVLSCLAFLDETIVLNHCALEPSFRSLKYLTMCLKDRLETHVRDEHSLIDEKNAELELKDECLKDATGALELALVKTKFLDSQVELLIKKHDAQIMSEETLLHGLQLDFSRYNEFISQCITCKEVEIYALKKAMRSLRKKYRISLRNIKFNKEDSYRLKKRLQRVAVSFKKRIRGFGTLMSQAVAQRDSLLASVNSYEKHVEKITADKLRSDKELEDLTATLKVRLDELEVLNHDKQLVENELISLKDKYLESESKHDQLIYEKECALQEMNKSLSLFKSENFQLHEEVVNIMASLEKLKTQMSNDAVWKKDIFTTPEFQMLETANKQHLAEKEVLTTENLKLTKLLQEIENVMLKWKEFIPLWDKISENYHSFLDLPVLLGKLEQEVSGLIQKVTAEENLCSLYKKQLTDLQEQNTVLSGRIKQEENCIVELQKQIGTLCDGKEKAIEQLNVAKTDIINLNEELSSWKSKYETKASFAADLEKKNEALEHANKMLNATIEEVEDNLQEVFSEKRHLEDSFEALKLQLANQESMALKKQETVKEQYYVANTHINDMKDVIQEVNSTEIDNLALKIKKQIVENLEEQFLHSEEKFSLEERKSMVECVANMVKVCTEANLNAEDISVDNTMKPESTNCTLHSHSQMHSEFGTKQVSILHFTSTEADSEDEFHSFESGEFVIANEKEVLLHSENLDADVYRDCNLETDILISNINKLKDDANSQFSDVYNKISTSDDLEILNSNYDIGQSLIQLSDSCMSVMSQISDEFKNLMENAEFVAQTNQVVLNQQVPCDPILGTEKGKMKSDFPENSTMKEVVSDSSLTALVENAVNSEKDFLIRFSHEFTIYLSILHKLNTVIASFNDLTLNMFAGEETSSSKVSKQSTSGKVDVAVAHESKAIYSVVEKLKEELAGSFSTETLCMNYDVMEKVKIIFKLFKKYLMDLCQTLENNLSHLIKQEAAKKSTLDDLRTLAANEKKKLDDHLQSCNGEKHRLEQNMKLVLRNSYRLEKDYHSLVKKHALLSDKLKSIENQVPQSSSLMSQSNQDECVTDKSEILSKKLEETELQLEEIQNKLSEMYSLHDVTKRALEKSKREYSVLKANYISLQRRAQHAAESNCSKQVLVESNSLETSDEGDHTPEKPSGKENAISVKLASFLRKR